MGGGRITSLALVYLLLIPDFASGAIILQGPQNSTVLVGSNPSFSCTVQAGWQGIIWTLSGVFTVTITSAGTIVSNAAIGAENSTNPTTGAFTTTITIFNVNRSDSGAVRCSSLSTTAQDAYLSVQVKGSLVISDGNSVTVTPNTTVTKQCRASEWSPAPSITWEINNTAASNSYYSTDYVVGADGLVTGVSTFTINPLADTNLTCLAKVQALNQPETATVTIAVREHVPGSGSGLSRTDIILIAVFVTIGGLLILGIIIAIIVICCMKKKKKKKETGYQSEAWRAPQQDVSNLRIPERAFPGEYINRAFTPEPVTVAPKFRSDQSDSAFSEASSTPRSHRYQASGREREDHDHSKKIRHVTHV